MSARQPKTGLPSIQALSLSQSDPSHSYHHATSRENQCDINTRGSVQQRSHRTPQTVRVDRDHPFIPPRAHPTPAVPERPPIPSEQTPTSASELLILDDYDHFPALDDDRPVGFEFNQWTAPHSAVPRTYHRGHTSPQNSLDSETPQSSHNALTSHCNPFPSSSSSSQSSGHDSQNQSPLTDLRSIQLPAADSSYTDTGDYLRQQLDLPAELPVNLDALPDPPPGQRPSQPLPVLIKLAIFGSPRQKLTLQEIYAALEKRFDWFREHHGDRAWMHSIRHNLSLNQVFRNSPRPITEPGKGAYWVLDVSQGEGYKRERKRSRKKRGRAITENDEMSDRDNRGSAPDTGRELMEGYQVGAWRVKSMPRKVSPYPKTALSVRTGPPIITTPYQSGSESPSPPSTDSPSHNGSSGLPYTHDSSPNQGRTMPYPLSKPSSRQPSFGRTTVSQPTFGQPAFGQPSSSQFQVSRAGPPPPVFFSNSEKYNPFGTLSCSSACASEGSTDRGRNPAEQVPGGFKRSERVNKYLA